MNISLVAVICLLLVWVLWREFNKQEREDAIDLIEVDDPAGREVIAPAGLSAHEKAIGHVVVVTDAPDMALDEAKQKAAAIISEHGYDDDLLHVFLKVKHYGFFARHSDGEQRWNFGVQNISAETKDIEIGYYKVKMDFVTFFINKDLISIGFATHRVSHPDHYKVFELIQYIYNNRLIMTLEYENEIAEAHHHRADHGHFCFTTAEEFHRDDEALAMLTHMAQMIAEHNQRQSGRHHEHHDESYRGKFSFKH